MRYSFTAEAQKQLGKVHSDARTWSRVAESAVRSSRSSPKKRDRAQRFERGWLHNILRERHKPAARDRQLYAARRNTQEQDGSGNQHPCSIGIMERVEVRAGLATAQCLLLAEVGGACRVSTSVAGGSTEFRRDKSCGSG